MVLHRQRLIDAGISETEIKTLEESVADQLDEAVERARTLAAPSPTTLFDFVVRERPVIADPSRPDRRRTGDPHHGRHPRRTRGGARRPTNASSSPESTWAKEAMCSA